MTALESAFSPWLELWLDRLSAEGYRIGINERLLVYSLLARLAVRNALPNDPRERLRLLGPLLCGNPDQQRHYAGLVETFARLNTDTHTGETAPPGGGTTDGRTVVHRRFRRGWMGLLAILGLASLIWLLQPLWRVETPDVPPSGEPVNPKKPKTHGGSEDTTKLFPLPPQTPITPLGAGSGSTRLGRSGTRRADRDRAAVREFPGRLDPGWLAATYVPARHI